MEEKSTSRASPIGQTPGRENYRLELRRIIPASLQRVWDAWTRPELLRQWFGPGDVVCTGAEVDLRVGGAYRLDNRLPDGVTVRISGTYEEVETWVKLVFNWRVQGMEKADEMSRVTVRFFERGEETELVIFHESIPTDEIAENHRLGWTGCLDKLESGDWY